MQFHGEMILTRAGYVFIARSAKNRSIRMEGINSRNSV
jgi:hypothetical protein